MATEEFKASYLRLCKDHHVEPQDSVLHQLAVYVFYGPFLNCVECHALIISDFVLHNANCIHHASGDY